MTYTDNMRDMENNEIKSYQNLQPISASAIPPSTKNQVGSLAVTFLNPNYPLGAAAYRIQGAKTISIDIYTWLGTFGALLPGSQDGLPMIGMPAMDMSHIYSQQLYPLLLGENGMIYGYVDGRLHKLTNTNDNFFRLLPTQERVQNLIGYGVNVYYSADGTTFRRIDIARELGHTKVHADWVFERFIGNVPSDAAIVLVEINDFTSMDVQRGSGDIVQVKTTGNMRTILSQISFSGQNLILGIPEPVNTSPQQQEEVASSSSSLSSSRSSSSRSSTAASSSASSYNSSKFEGEVTSASRSQSSRASSSSTSPKKVSSSSSSDTTSHVEGEFLPTPAPEPPTIEKPDIVRIEPRDSGGGAVTGVGVYIAVMTGLVLVLLLRKR